MYVNLPECNDIIFLVNETVCLVDAYQEGSYTEVGIPADPVYSPSISHDDDGGFKICAVPAAVPPPLSGCVAVKQLIRLERPYRQDLDTQDSPKAPKVVPLGQRCATCPFVPAPLRYAIRAQGLSTRLEGNRRQPSNSLFRGRTLKIGRRIQGT